MEKKTILLSAAMLAFATTAQAADLGYNGEQFNGPYVGLFVAGGAKSDSACAYGYCARATAGNAAIGASFGYLFQMNNFVLGAEVDIAAAGMSIDVDYGGRVNGNGYTTAGKIKAGFVIGDFLLFAGGGVTYTDITFKKWGYRANGDDTGYIAGGGIQWMFADGVSWRSEINYLSTYETAQFRTGIDFRF